MPFVIQSSEGPHSGEFLRVKHNASRGHRREWVASIVDATTWSKIGHAKAAAIAAGSDAFGIGEIEFYEVALRPVRYVERARVIKTGGYTAKLTIPARGRERPRGR